MLAFVLGLPLKVLIGEEGGGGTTAGEGLYTRLYSTCKLDKGELRKEGLVIQTMLLVTCCSFFPVVLFPSFSFFFSFCSVLAGAAKNSFLVLVFSFFESSLCFRGGVGRYPPGWYLQQDEKFEKLWPKIWSAKLTAQSRPSFLDCALAPTAFSGLESDGCYLPEAPEVILRNV